MRTKGQQNLNQHLTGTTDMLKDLKDTLLRSHATLAQDVAGLSALVVILLVGLHLPLIA